MPKKPKDKLSRLAVSLDAELERYSDSLSSRVAGELWADEDTELSEPKWREWALTQWAKDPIGFPASLKDRLGPRGFVAAYGSLFGLPKSDLSLPNVAAKAALNQLPHQQLFPPPIPAPLAPESPLAPGGAAGLPALPALPEAPVVETGAMPAAPPMMQVDALQNAALPPVPPISLPGMPLPQ